MIFCDMHLRPEALRGALERFWELSAAKIRLTEARYDDAKGSPVFTINGQWVTRGWTEWTQGFQFGSAILQYDATNEAAMLESGRDKTVKRMAPHLTHTGVHDHGFNNISTYGHLLRLMHEGRLPRNEWERNYYTLALKVSGAVQAGRWTRTKDGGFIHSFNGPHSLFVDTIRSVRSLVLAHSLGHVLQAEGDIRISLLDRAVQHLEATAAYSIYYGEGRDEYDIWGRTAHESVFNMADGNYRCPNSQQGYSGFTTWTRGLAWAICGFAEQLEYFDQAPAELEEYPGFMNLLTRAARATADFYLGNTPVDGVPYWDTGAPGLSRMGDYLARPADPFNEWEPVDSSAAAIAAQGLLRLGRYLQSKADNAGEQYWHAGLTVMNTLLQEPYLSTGPDHQGLLLHAVYHRPNGWDHVPPGSKVPNGESAMWGDYHLREAALYLQRVIDDQPAFAFFKV